MPNTTNPRRRRFRYSLRTLLLLVTVVSLPFGWLGYKVRQAQRQREAVEAIRKLGGDVIYNYQFDPTGNFFADATPSSPLWLRELLGIDFFENTSFVKLARTPITDADLIHLPFTTLTRLNLSNTNITDEGLVYLQSLTAIGTLDLDGTQVTDAGMIHLRGLSELKFLNLDRTKITDAGLNIVRQCTQLEHLSLVGTQITDAGLAALHVLTNLQTLYVGRTEVTDNGHQEIQQALPQLRIY